MKIGQKVSAKLTGIIRSDETRARMRTAQQNRSPEFMLPAHRANTGAKRTDETKAKMRAAKLGKPLSEAHKAALRVASSKREKIHYIVTDKTRAKMSRAKLGRPLTEDHKKKIGDGNRGKTYAKRRVILKE